MKSLSSRELMLGRRYVLLSLICLLFSSQSFAQTNNNLTLRGHVAYSKPISNLWGYVDSLGNEYALVGAWNGVSIVNVTNPDSPKIVKTIPSVHPISGQSVTREVKTWKTFAYSTNDNQTDSGLLIIDLSHLPDTSHIAYHQYISHGLTVAHTLWIDEHGILYAYGFDTTGNQMGLFNRGAMLFDLNQDPYNPRYITQYNGSYVHDGFVRGDTLWACEIYTGQFAVINVKDTNSLKVMATQKSVGHATHNAWPTANDHYVFVTDEISPGSYLQSYDVSDLSNITLMGKVESNPGSGSTVHNVHLINDTFAVTSYYTDGVVIFDVSHPDNMIEVGNYDTSPLLSGPGLNGCWGVYPYLPSHNIIASDIQNGLFVFTPRYKHACWLEGNVTDSSDSVPLGQVIIKILPSLNNDTTDFLGNYKTGTVDSGQFDVQFSKYGYITKTIHNVSFQPNVVTTLNVQLRADFAFSLAVSVTDSFNNPVKYAKVWITDNSQYSTISTTDSTGKLLVNPLYGNTYDIYAGAWGCKTIKLTGQRLTVSTDSLNIKIGRGYYDDFTFDFGWQSTGTAATGLWTRIFPTVGLNNGLPLNPTSDVLNDIGNECYLTGNQLKNLGVEGGTAILTSPAFDLSTGIDPNLQYYKWFTDYNSGKQPTDSLVISLSNGDTTVAVDVTKPGKDSLSTWVHNNIRIKDFLSLTSNMHFIISTSQSSALNDVVGALDKFEITDSLANAVITLTGAENQLEVYPNPFSNTVYISGNLNGPKSIEVFNLLGEMIYQNSFNVNGSSPIKLNLSGLVKGVYFVRELTAEGDFARMIIKE